MKTMFAPILQIAAVLLCFLAGAMELQAQPVAPPRGPGPQSNTGSGAPIIQVVENMRFPAMNRPDSRSIGFLDAYAAKFIIDAEPERKLIVSVSTDHLVREEELHEGGKRTMNLKIDPEDCAYSLDNGVTWVPFGNNIHHQQIVTPKAFVGESTSRVLVRVGGSITSHQNQRRGDYLGEVTLTVEYQ